MDEVHRFVLFAGSKFYPAGGWKDYRGSFMGLEQAIIGAANLTTDRDWWQVVDMATGKIVREGKST